ncbi:copper chaperone CopZ [Bacillus thermotolerans]|uniref:Copper chaperone CopZ n=1 Tax=Bacillus thermotolerans TaxID=1221996 RepID=A0A0F5HR13_BACTR|nr:copper chaperone CopZ [Bacillus thermotolerans]KKB33933.1 Copper(I) chaperone CopZ [Bacillus thermotolerans]KKB35693.1 Copper(I) chaperone CopZ [Bacillus thermotolerans]KKB37508.1 Copper(I) chaperone CopZ [Bacillus thermotolerans]
MEQVILYVQGMSCGHCVRSIEGSVGQLKGVELVKVHLAEGKVEVAFDANTVSLKEIKEVIEDQGYDVEQEQPV